MENTFCTQCGKQLTEGKHICSACVTAPENSSLEIQSSQPPPLISATAPDFPITDSLTEASPIITADSPSSTFSVSPIQEAKPNSTPIFGISLAAVLVLALCALGWYEYSHRMLPPNTASALQLQNSAPKQQPQTSDIISPPVLLSKPSPAVPLNTNSNISHTTPTPTPTPKPTPTPVPTPTPKPIQAPTHAQITQPSAPISTYNASAPKPAPRPAPQPALANSGALHYQGRPVPYGGVVSFDNLPKARLKYTFDHSSWRISLTNNPDGTRKGVQLTSIKQGLQTNCDLGWEIAP
jgi:hypothetical protein